jgi:hypothetical protein
MQEQDTAQAYVLDTERGRWVPSNLFIFQGPRTQRARASFAAERFLISFVL